MSEERLSGGAERGIVVELEEVRRWVAELAEIVRRAETISEAACDRLLAEESKAATGRCQLCNRAFGIDAERMPNDARFCQRCASGAAYRDLRERQAEAHRAKGA